MDVYIGLGYGHGATYEELIRAVDSTDGVWRWCGGETYVRLTGTQRAFIALESQLDAQAAHLFDRAPEYARASNCARRQLSAAVRAV
jgi:hypothetical protein